MKHFWTFLLLASVLMILSCGDENSSDTTSSGTDTATQQPDAAVQQPTAATPTATETTTETESEPERGDYVPPEDTSSGGGDGEMVCDHVEPCGDPVPYVRHICTYPLSPQLDGDLSDDVWTSTPWGQVTYTDGPVTPDSDADGSYEFACVADSKYMYFAFRIKDDVIISGESSGCDVWKDDALELYIDQCYQRADSYEGDDAQIAIGADTIGITDQANIVIGGCAGPLNGDETGTLVHTKAADGGWVGEVAIPLKIVGGDGWDITPENGKVIGFQTQYNDDDDEGDRDHKLIWSELDQASDISWEDPSVFGELQFCQLGGAPDTAADGGDVTADAGDDSDTGDKTMDAGNDASMSLDAGN